MFLETTKFLHPTQFLQQQNEDERRLTKYMDNFPMKRSLFSKGKSCTGESLKNNHKADLSLRMNLTHKKHKKSTSRWENFKGSHVLVVDWFFSYGLNSEKTFLTGDRIKSKNHSIIITAGSGCIHEILGPTLDSGEILSSAFWFPDDSTRTTFPRRKSSRTIRPGMKNIEFHRTSTFHPQTPKSRMLTSPSYTCCNTK